MDHSTNLQHLPVGIVIPAELEGRIRYDEQRRELHFQGFMTKYVHDQLVSLSTDIEYHRAVERLFVLSASGAGPPARRFKPLHLGVALAVTLATCIVAVWAWRTMRNSPETPLKELPSSSDHEHHASVDRNSPRRDEGR